jgi:hypothetical protein
MKLSSFRGYDRGDDKFMWLETCKHRAESQTPSFRCSETCNRLSQVSRLSKVLCRYATNTIEATGKRIGIQSVQITD